MNRLSSVRVVSRVVQKVATRSLVMSAAPSLSSIRLASFPVSLPRASFSKKAAPSLTDVLAGEIEHEENSFEVDQELVDITKKIGKVWKIQSEDGSAVVTLTRQFNSENIEVKFDVQNVNEDVQFEDQDDEDHGAGDEDNEDEMVNNFGIDFETTITKGKGKLVLHCTATDDDVVYRNLRYLPSEKANDDMEFYGGPTLEDLDENLQSAIDGFLEKRGIDRELSFFVMAYAREKEQKEYVRWLRNLHDFASTNSDDDTESSDLESTDVLLFLFFGLGIGILVTQILSHWEDTVPYTVVIFVIGVIFSATDGHKNTFGKSVDQWVNINADLLLFAFLPPLIFGEAMYLNWHHVKGAFLQSAILAGPGVLIGAALMGVFAKAILPYNWAWNLCMVFGAILSATDP
eukprot:gene37399-45416_t